MQAQGTGGGYSNKCIVWPKLLKHPPAADAKFWELMNNPCRPLSHLNDVTRLVSARISSLLSPNHLNGSLISPCHLTEAAAFKTQRTSIYHFCIPASLPQPLSALPSYSPLICFSPLSFFNSLSRDTPSQSQTTTQT